MNKFYFTTALVCTSLSLSACAKDLYDNTTPKPVVTDDKVEVLVEVQNQGTSNTTENISLELDIQKESKDKTVYEVWENYAPRKDYDETETEQSYSDPAFTTAIKPAPNVKAKPKKPTKPTVKPKAPENVIIDKKPIIEDITIIDKIEDKPEDKLDVFTPITTKPAELTQEQKDAAAALLPPDIVPPPPADNEELIILRREGQTQ